MDMKEFKTLATNTCVEAITSTSKNLVEVIATKLQALHKSSGVNEPLKFNKAEAEKMAFDARCNFNKLKGVPYPKKRGYDNSKNGGFASFRARELELTKIVQNIEHYDDAKAACDDLVKAGTFRQAGASEIVRAMAAIGGGKTVDTFKTDAITSASTRTTNKTEADAKAITPEGFTERLASLIEAAEEHRIVLGEDGKTFVAMPEAKADDTVIENMPDSGETVLDSEALQAMLDMPAYQAASEGVQDRLMAAFMRR